MNKQVNPDHCYETDDGVMYMLEPAYGTSSWNVTRDGYINRPCDSPEWHVLKNGQRHRTFTSLMAAKGWLEHVLQHPQSDR